MPEDVHSVHRSRMIRDVARRPLQDDGLAVLHDVEIVSRGQALNEIRLVDPVPRPIEPHEREKSGREDASKDQIVIAAAETGSNQGEPARAAIRQKTMTGRRAGSRAWIMESDQNDDMASNIIPSPGVEGSR